MAIVSNPPNTTAGHRSEPLPGDAHMAHNQCQCGQRRPSLGDSPRNHGEDPGRANVMLKLSGPEHYRAWRMPCLPFCALGSNSAGHQKRWPAPRLNSLPRRFLHLTIK